jgi:hypothetical protein
MTHFAIAGIQTHVGIHNNLPTLSHRLPDAAAQASEVDIRAEDVLAVEQHVTAYPLRGIQVIQTVQDPQQC